MSKAAFPFLKAISATVLGAAAVGATVFYVNTSSNSVERPDTAQEKIQVSDKNERSTDRNPILTDVEELVSSDRKFIRPKFSPDGKKILLTTEGNSGLFYVSVDAPQKIVELSSDTKIGFGAAWSANGKQVFFNKKDDKFRNHVKSIGIDNSEITAFEDVHFSSIQSYAATNGQGPVLTLNMNTLNIFAALPSEGKEWLVTTEEGRYYQHILSPDRKKMLVHSGQDLMVYKTDGSGLYAKLGKAIGTSWSPDGKYIIGYLDESTDGHETSGSELYLYKADGSQNWKLTDTPDRMEMWPTWSSEGKTIVFADGETGRIYSAQIKVNN